MTSIEYLRFSIVNEMQEEFIRAIKGARVILSAYPACLNNEISHCQENDSLFIWRIEWESTDAHMNGFRKSTEFMPFFKIMEPFVNSVIEMNHYSKLD